MCNNEGLLQVIGKHYFRVRHYDGTHPETHKPKFHYHPVLEDYANQQLELTNQSLPSKDNARLNTKAHETLTKLNQTIPVLDPTDLNNRLKSEVAGGEGFEPSTPNLGGWCSIREQFKSKREPPPLQWTVQSVLSYSPTTKLRLT